MELHPNPTPRSVAGRGNSTENVAEIKHKIIKYVSSSRPSRLAVLGYNLGRIMPSIDYRRDITNITCSLLEICLSSIISFKMSNSSRQTSDVIVANVGRWLFIKLER